MKIVYVYSALTTVGGADRVITEKINYMADVLGYDMYIITASQLGKPLFFPLSERAHHIDLGINFDEQYQYGSVKRFLCYKRLMKTYKQQLADALMTISPDITISTCGRDMDFLVKLKDGNKKMAESHTTLKNLRNLHLMEERPFPFPLIAKYWRHKMACNIKKLDAFVVLTKHDAKLWECVKVPHVIPNSLPFGTSKQSSCTNKRVIAVGRLSEEKAFDKLIKAWGLVANKHDDWTLDIFGEGEKELELQNLIHQQGLEGSLHLHKPTKQIMDEYAESSLCVMSSRYEGFGMVLIEAMSCGVPCIAFNCPNGPKEIIEQDKNGILVENGNIEKLAEAIDWMISHDEERAKMGIYAMDSVKKYSREQVMLMWDNLFKSLKNK